MLILSTWQLPHQVLVKNEHPQDRCGALQALEIFKQQNRSSTLNSQGPFFVFHFCHLSFTGFRQCSLVNVILNPPNSPMGLLFPGIISPWGYFFRQLDGFVGGYYYRGGVCCLDFCDAFRIFYCIFDKILGEGYSRLDKQRNKALGTGPNTGNSPFETSLQPIWQMPKLLQTSH